MQVAEAGPVPILPDGTPRVLFCGATTLDTIVQIDAIPTGPEKVLPRQMTVVSHAMAASVAPAAAQLDARSALFLRLGDDEYGQRFCDDLNSADVDCSGVRLFPGIASSLCTLIVDDEGVRLLVPYYDACLPSDPGWLPLKRVAEAEAVRVDVRWSEGARALLGSARNAGISAVLDTDIGPRDVLMGLARRASFVVFSEFRARIPSGVEEAEEALTRPSVELDGFLAITLGEKGCIWMEGDEVRRARPRPTHTIFQGSTK